ncbi:MAG: mechanosensitive ion channel domain-containing protein [Paracoccaceae bacterium]
MPLILLRYVVVFVLAVMFASPSFSQTGLLGALGSSEEETTENVEGAGFAETLQQAVDSGVSVVVVDSNGDLLAQSDEIDEGTGTGIVEDDSALLMKIQAEGDAFRAILLHKLEALPNAFREVAYILRSSSPDGRIMSFVEALFYSLALFALGMLVEAEVFGKRFAKRFVVSRILENPIGYSEKLPFLMFRFFMGVLGALVSMAVAYVTGSIIFGPLDDTAMQFTIAVIYSAYFGSRLVSGLWRMVLSPYLSQYRIPTFSDTDAKKLHNWLWILAVVDIWSLSFTIWIFELGLNYDVYAAMSSLLSLIIVVLNVLLVLTNRKAITNAIMNGKTSGEVTAASRFFCKIWAPVAIAYFTLAWFELTYELVLQLPSSVPLIAGAYAILMSIIVVFGVINFAIERFFQRARALQESGDKSLLTGDEALVAKDGVADETANAPKSRDINSFEGLARRVSGILALVAGAWAFISIWDFESSMMEESRLDTLTDIIVVIFIGYIVYNLFRIWIDSKIEEEVGDEPEGELGDEGSISSASRLATLLPLFRNGILAIVAISVVLIILLELGVNVSPLFAGAGVVGLAIGFGSQALVRDVFSGAFFLFDDAFRKGEYIDIGDVKGTVEKISIRSFQLRHHKGPLHTIPFGEIRFLTNFSRDWVIMKLPLRVTYDTDVEKVRKLIKKLGIQLLDDPVIGKDFIQPLKSQGIIEMQDSAMIIRVKFMTTPNEQWVIRKRVFEEIRALFEREGIRFAHREVTVRLADGKVEDLTPDQKEAVTAAAQSAIDDGLAPESGSSGDDR